MAQESIRKVSTSQKSLPMIKKLIAYYEEKNGFNVPQKYVVDLAIKKLHDSVIKKTETTI